MWLKCYQIPKEDTFRSSKLKLKLVLFVWFFLGGGGGTANSEFGKSTPQKYFCRIEIKI